MMGLFQEQGYELTEQYDEAEIIIINTCGFVNAAKVNHVCSEEDLCQEGRMAIVVAYRNFDPDHGASLTTWVYHMIKSSIIEYQKHHLSVLSGGAYLQGILRKAVKRINRVNSQYGNGCTYNVKTIFSTACMVSALKTMIASCAVLVDRNLSHSSLPGLIMH